MDCKADQNNKTSMYYEVFLLWLANQGTFSTCDKAHPARHQCKCSMSQGSFKLYFKQQQQKKLEPTYKIGTSL